jgi:HEAT repeat protein
MLLLAFFPLFLCEIISSAAEDPICIEQLIAELAHPDPNRRWDAVAALGAGGDSRAVPPLMRALEKDMKERTGIAMAIIPALGQMGDERAVPLLLKALNKLDEDWLGREAAARALGDIGSPKVVPDLIRTAWRAETRNAAIKALAAIGDPRATDVLLSALSEPEEPEAREAAIAGLTYIGEPAVPALIDKLNTRREEYPENHERALAAMILGRIGDRRAVDPLTRALDDPNEEVRKSAETALERMIGR